MLESSVVETSLEDNALESKSRGALDEDSCPHRSLGCGVPCCVLCVRLVKRRETTSPLVAISKEYDACCVPL